MKKILTLVLALGTISSVFAQSRNDHDRDDHDRDNNRYAQTSNNYGNNYRSYSNSYNTRERDMQIANINREYEARSYAVRSNRWLRNNEKNRQLYILDNQRAAAISQLNSRYADSRYAGRNDRYYTNDNNRNYSYDNNRRY